MWNNVSAPLNIMTGLEDVDQSIGFMEVKVSDPNKGFSQCFGKGKGAAGASSSAAAATPNFNAVNNNICTNYENTSEDDEPEDGNGENNHYGAKGEKGSSSSPWQRMKWTDNIVRLLIHVVACVGDDSALEGGDGPKRRSGILQKKGKWKTVSKIMISKGCYVSPQQCEDKFNDLNKRYKRLNDILGRGTSCRVVEDPSLMDSMPQLSAKMKEDVKKVLSSKHLFYKEICAYHNGQRIPNCSDLDLQVHALPLVQSSRDNNGSEAEEAEENDESEDDRSNNEENNNAAEGVERKEDYGETNKVSGDGNFWSQSGGQGGFLREVAEIFQDPKKSKWEKTVWVKKRMLQLQEERVSIQAEAFELEKRLFKWQRFCSKKDRELEISRLENERLILENERMTLQLKQKEVEIDSKSTGPSFDPNSLSIDIPQGRDRINFGRHH